MQNRRTLKVLILVLSLICLYELSFTIFTKGFESEITEEADGDYTEYTKLLKERENDEVWMGYTYLECKKREINLGLDLRGGVSVTLEISMKELIQAMAGENANSPEFQTVIDKADELQKSEQAPYVDLFYQAYKEAQGDRPIVQWFMNRNNDYTPETKDEEIIETLRDNANTAINQANEVLRSRVKQFGIAQPDIRKLGNTGRIIVDLPGVKDINRVRGLLQGSANLEFWDVYDWGDLKKEAGYLAEAYAVQRQLKLGLDTLTKDSTASADSIANNLDSLAAEQNFQNPFANLALYGGRAFSMTFPVKDTAEVNKFFGKAKNRKLLPRTANLAWEGSPRSTVEGANDLMSLYLLKANRKGGPMMEGDIIKYARADFDSRSGQKIVSLDFKVSEVKNWEKVTAKSYQQQKPIAIVLDGIVFSAPTASGAISGGSTQITGGTRDNDTWNKDLANVLNAGKFPAPVKIVEESFVGPSLGKQSIQAGFVSFVIALIVVLIYMVFYYSTAGWVANVALLANIFFIVGALANFTTISLTLPGLAGIVLTVGMSVDANVLIYERIREELRLGKGVKSAITDGYKNSYTAILDANITTLITGIILWYFGTGVIESFAQTLVIGIFSSLFSAIFITRLVFEALIAKEKAVKFASNMTEKLFASSAYQFVANRKKFYLVSLVIIAIGVGSIVTRKFDLGTDFSGGRTFKVQFAEEVDEDEVRTALGAVFTDDKGNKMKPEVKTYGDKTKLAITTKYLYEDQTKTASLKVEQALFSGLESFVTKGMTFEQFSAQNDDKTEGLMQSYSVGPSIADDIIDAAIQSIIIALIAIFLYIVFRFREWQFGAGALAAIFHDVLVVLSLFSLFYGVLPFSLEINQAFIAAILTVVGYSINDTVVVFDRIRETLPTKRVKPIEGVVNGALNSTISRTFNTSITIIVVLLAILIFGGESIQGFAFALLIGVIVGTYSSLCIAAPLYVDLVKKGNKENK